MKNQQIKRIAFCLSIFLSLFASSIAACTCGHHQVKAENHAPSCHQTTTETENQQTLNSAQARLSEKIDVNCDCFVKTFQPFVVGKSKNIKAQKNLAVLPLLIKPERFDVTSEVSSAKFHFEYYFYNSNYLKKLTPPRAPPVS